MPAIARRPLAAPGGVYAIVAQNTRLRWPDSLAEGSDGAIHVTASHIQDMAQFHDKGAMFKGSWPLFRFMPPKA